MRLSPFGTRVVRFIYAKKKNNNKRNTDNAELPGSGAGIFFIEIAVPETG